MRLKLFFIILIISLLPLSVSAQTTSSNNAVVGISLDYPESWVSTTQQVAEGVQALYLTDSNATLDAIINEPSEPMLSGRISLIHYPPSVVSNIGRNLVELQGLFPDAEWDEITVNDELAYKWSYEDERTQGFVVLYELADGSLSFSVADTAIGELDDELDAMLMEIIASVESYSLAESIEEGLDFSETAVVDDFPFTFQYPAGWYVSQVEEIADSLIVSASTSGTSFSEFSGQSILLLTQVSLESLGIDSDLPLETGHMSMRILDSYVEAAAEGGTTFSEVELIEIDGIPVGRVASDTGAVIYMLVLDEELIAQVWVVGFDEDEKIALEIVAQELIATISTDIPEVELSTELLGILDSASELDASFTMENGIAFDYPDNWSVLEDNGLVLVSNLEEVEDFTAQSGEILLIISAVPVEERDLVETLVRIQEVTSVMAEFPDFDINIFRIDDSDTISETTFDVGEAAVNWNFSGGLISTSGETLNGAVFIIMNQGEYDSGLATHIINPILGTFRLTNDE